MNNYFQLFGIEERFDINTKQLTDNYQLLQKKLHPDNYVHADSQQQRLAEHNSAHINHAYNLLIHPVTRAQHLLTLLHKKPESSEKKTLGSELLMLHMELNEQLEETSAAEDLMIMYTKIQSRIADIEKQLTILFNQETATLNIASAIEQLQFFDTLLTRIDKKKRGL